MRVLRLLVAGLIAIGAVVAVFLAAVVVFFTGLAAYILQLFQTKDQPASTGRPSGSDRPAPLRTDDVIDVVTTKAPAESPDSSDRAI